MTFAEVIDTLQTWIRNADDEYDREEMGRVAGLKEALHEIKKIEPCEDCISRQAAIDVMYDLCDTGETLEENPWRDNPHIDAITDALDDLPPITPQPDTGHWIAQDIHNCHTGFKCSECGYIHSFMHLYGKPTADYTYCPNCGAKMIEP